MDNAPIRMQNDGDSSARDRTSPLRLSEARSIVAARCRSSVPRAVGSSGIRRSRAVECSLRLGRAGLGNACDSGVRSPVPPSASSTFPAASDEGPRSIQLDCKWPDSFGDPASPGTIFICPRGSSDRVWWEGPTNRVAIAIEPRLLTQCFEETSHRQDIGLTQHFQVNDRHVASLMLALRADLEDGLPSRSTLWRIPSNGAGCVSAKAVCRVSTENY